jgi:hypothetical protein
MTFFMIEKDEMQHTVGTQTNFDESADDKIMYPTPISVFQESLATDVLINIFGWLDPSSLSRASRVCLLWKVFIILNFNSNNKDCCRELVSMEDDVS